MPEIMSLLCFASVLLAIIFNIFFLEIVYIFIHKTIKFKKSKNVQTYIKIPNRSEVIENAELQRAILYKKFGVSLLRPSLSKRYSDVGDGDTKVSCLLFFCLS